MGPRRGLAKKRVGAERTPEGKPICFRYNAPNGCKKWGQVPLRTCVLAMLPEPLLEGSAPLSFFTNAEAENGRAWIGGFLELVDGCHGPWFSLEVKPEWAP